MQPLSPMCQFCYQNRNDVHLGRSQHTQNEQEYCRCNRIHVDQSRHTVIPHDKSCDNDETVVFNYFYRLHERQVSVTAVFEVFTFAARFMCLMLFHWIRRTGEMVNISQLHVNQ